ncbi:MAG: alanine racemase [Xanthomonadales bacterium]|nr:alanine racemase [Xanthomonadales bacterium]
MHLHALRHNLARVRELAAPARVMAVVKADAYGHGLERVARALADADAFGVAAIADGLRLRAAGHRQRIVVLAGPDSASDLAELRRLQLDAVIHHDSQLDWLDADRGTTPIRVWLKVDSGMHRLGFAAERVAAVHARLSAMPAVADDIVLMTHFAASDEFDSSLTTAQIACFEQATSGLPGPRSLSNSAAVLGWPTARGDWVRAGGLLYGLSVVEGKSGADFGFAPAMTLATRLIAINSIRQGEYVGYGALWQAPVDMPLGVAAIGYGDGYPRSIAAGTPVVVDGKPAQIIGRVSMDLIAIDLRSAATAKVGAPVLLWGPELPVETIANHAASISYELTCGVTRRVLFVEDDR